MSRKKIKSGKAPPPRAGILVDAILQRNGNVVDIRKMYVGPRDLAVVDLVEMVAAIAAVAFINCIKNPEDLLAAKADLLAKLDRMITVRGGNGSGVDPNLGHPPQQLEGEEPSKENEDDEA
jgi:hypothetical protein